MSENGSTQIMEIIEIQNAMFRKIPSMHIAQYFITLYNENTMIV